MSEVGNGDTHPFTDDAKSAAQPPFGEQPLSHEQELAAQNSYYRQTAEHFQGRVIEFEQVTTTLSERMGQLALENAELRTENARLDEEASLNPVSRFYNERGLQRRFDELMRANPGAELAVIAVDLGSFKAVNDELGHHEGDNLLRLVGKLFRTADIEAIVANPHGDEFVIVTPMEARRDPKLTNRQRINAITGRLKGVGRLLALQNAELARVGFSISAGGVVHEHGKTLQQTLEQADEKMYEDKKESLPPLTPEQLALLEQRRVIDQQLAKAGLPPRQANKYLDQ